MADNQFQFLDDDSIVLMEADAAARASYIDLLSLVHDLLVPYASESERARFPAAELLGELTNLVHAFPAHSQVGAAARSNIAFAQWLHSQAGSAPAKARAKTEDLQPAVDVFLGDLLRQYDQIRHIRSRGGVVTRA